MEVLVGFIGCVYQVRSPIILKSSLVLKDGYERIMWQQQEIAETSVNCETAVSTCKVSRLTLGL